MTKIAEHLKYDRTIFLYAASRTLERSAYYGMRSIILIYMVKGILSIPEMDSMQFYDWFVQSLVVTGVIGALFGDFVLGNRKALLLGTVLMSIGLFLLCIPVRQVFYTAVGLFVLGSGFYTPNLLARFGKQFYNKPELTDGGFSILYVLVNIGAALGIALIMLAGFTNYVVGFALCGIMMLGSVVLSFINEDTASDEAKPVTDYNNANTWLIVLLTIFGVGLYWYLYQSASGGLSYIQARIAESHLAINPTFWQTLSTALIIVIGIGFAALYSYHYFGRALKLALGFIVAALAFGIALQVSFPVTPTASAIMFLVIFLFSIAELVMAPVLYGVIVERTNPKYLALVISLSFVPFAALRIVMFYAFRETPTETSSIKIAAPIIAVMGVIALVAWIMGKKKNVELS